MAAVTGVPGDKASAGGTFAPGFGASSVTNTSSLTATLSFVGSQQKATSAHESGTLSFVGSKTAALSRSLSGTLSFVGSSSKALTRALSGTLSFVGTRTSGLGRALTGVLSFVGNLPTTTNFPLLLEATLSFVGAQSRSISRALAGTLDFIGSMTPVKGMYLSLAGTLSFSGNFSKGIGKALSGVLSFLGALLPNPTKTVPDRLVLGVSAATVLATTQTQRNVLELATTKHNTLTLTGDAVAELVLDVQALPDNLVLGVSAKTTLVVAATQYNVLVLVTETP